MYFEIHRASNGQYYFVIKSGNHQVVAQSETYISKQGAINTIDSIKRGVGPLSQVLDKTGY